MMRELWSSNWPLAVLVSAVLPVLLVLGFWQLERADNKRDVLARQQAQETLPPLILESVRGDLPEFRAVSVRGRYDTARYWLLENRIHQGRYGFEVISPFVLANGETVLVHRGWVPGDRGRRTLPEIETPVGELSLSGKIDTGSASGFSLGEEAATDTWPKRLQWLTTERAERELGAALPDLLLRLERGEAGMFEPTYSAVNMPPEKHTGYAVQWFGMAAIIVMLFGWRLWHQYRSQGDRSEQS